MRKSLIWAAGVALVCGMSSAANAAVTLVLGPQSGLDLGNIHVGDNFVLDLFLVGTPGEHFTGVGGGNVNLSGPVSFVGATFDSTSGNDFSTNPILFDITFHAVSAGPASISTSGTTIDTNVTTYPNLSSDPLNFNILAADVPEPVSWAMMVGGFGVLGSAMRRRQRVAFAPA